VAFAQHKDPRPIAFARQCRVAMRSFWTSRRSLLALLAIAPMAAAAQEATAASPRNLPDFHQRRSHFGFLVGFNRSGFFAQQAPFVSPAISAKDVEVQGGPGFDLGVVASFNMGGRTSLRFLPMLSFQERELVLHTYGPMGRYPIAMEDTWLQCPVLMQVRSGRTGDFAAHLLAGGRFGINMAQNDVPMTLARYDYGVEAGGGIDLFLPFFKLGIELRMGFGIPNLLVRDGNPVSAPLRSLRSRGCVLALTFEA